MDYNRGQEEDRRDLAPPQASGSTNEQSSSLKRRSDERLLMQQLAKERFFHQSTSDERPLARQSNENGLSPETVKQETLSPKYLSETSRRSIDLSTENRSVEWLSQNAKSMEPVEGNPKSETPRNTAKSSQENEAKYVDKNENANKNEKQSNENTKKAQTIEQEERILKTLRRSNLEQKHSATEEPTSFFHTLIHLFKGNVGPGMFAMGFAFSNGGLAMSPFLTILISLMCVNCQHMLLNCSKKMQNIYDLQFLPDFATTVELCFVNGPQRCIRHSTVMRKMVNMFIVITQLGFCCVYFVFVSSNINQILIANDMQMEMRMLMLIIFIPICLTSLIRNFKYLAPVSAFASLCMVVALLVTLIIAFNGEFTNISERRLYADIESLSVYYGASIFAFEGIALVLPLKNSMAQPHDFDKKLGVLNIGMTIVTIMFIMIGLTGYARWGEAIAGSVTLNVGDEPSGQFVKSLVSLGVVFGYPLQFHIAIQIMFPHIVSIFKVKKNFKLANGIFRVVLVLLTLGMAELVPALEYFISFIGALCCTVLALVFPPVVDIILHISGPNKHTALTKLSYIKNAIILCCAIYGFVVGTYSSLYGLITFFQKNRSN